MDNSDVLKLSLVAKEFAKDERNFTNYFKRVGDIEINFEEEIIKNGDVKKYLLVSKDIEKFYENNTLYVFDKLKNTKLKEIYKFDDFSFGDNVKNELMKIQILIQDEYVVDLKGVSYSMTSKSIRYEVNAKKAFEDGLTGIEYSEINVFAYFGEEDYLENISVNFSNGRYKSLYFEMGPKLNSRIDFQDNLNTYR
jgi:hypothetical protein